MISRKINDYGHIYFLKLYKNFKHCKETTETYSFCTKLIQQAFTSMHYELSICFYTGGENRGQRRRNEDMKKKGAFSSQYKIIQSGGDGGKDSSIKH